MRMERAPQLPWPASRILKYLCGVIAAVLALFCIYLVVWWAIEVKPGMDRACEREERQTHSTCDYWIK